MVDASEQERLRHGGGDRRLSLALATAVWSFLFITNLLAIQEALLVGWAVGFIVGYWLPPRPTISFIRWISERLGMLALAYILVFRGPQLFAPSLNRYIGFGVGCVLFIAVYFAWTKHPKSTLRLGRA
jgi:hypothetical protein